MGEGFHNWSQNIQGFPDGQWATLLLQISAQIASIYIFHSNVSSVIFLKAAQNLYDLGNTPELRQRFCFPEKTKLVVFKGFPVLAVITGYGKRIGISPGKATGEVFLDSNSLPRDLIPSEVCNAETALSQDFSQHILLAYNSSKRKLVRAVFAALIESAVLAMGAAFF